MKEDARLRRGALGQWRKPATNPMAVWLWATLNYLPEAANYFLKTLSAFKGILSFTFTAATADPFMVPTLQIKKLRLENSCPRSHNVTESKASRCTGLSL